MELYRSILIDEFEVRKARSSSFSLRAYARFLDLSPATLSRVLTSKRNLPLKKVEFISQKLNLDPIRKAAFKKSAEFSKVSLKGLSAVAVSALPSQVLDDQKDYNIIAKWEYYAILNLVKTNDFQFCPNWIGKRLNISISRVNRVLTELEERGLIEEVSGQIVRVDKNLETTQDVFSQALRDSHKENLKIAAEKIDQVSIEKRFFSSSTMAIDSDRLDEAKVLIREFREKLSELLSQNNLNEVYQFNLQLFPLTEVGKGDQNEPLQH